MFVTSSRTIGKSYPLPVSGFRSGVRHNFRIGVPCYRRTATSGRTDCRKSEQIVRRTTAKLLALSLVLLRHCTTDGRRTSGTSFFQRRLRLLGESLHAIQCTYEFYRKPNVHHGEREHAMNIGLLLYHMYLIVYSCLQMQTQNVFIPSARLILIVFVLHSSYRFFHLLLLMRLRDCIRSEEDAL